MIILMKYIKDPFKMIVAVLHSPSLHYIYNFTVYSTSVARDSYLPLLFTHPLYRKRRRMIEGSSNHDRRMNEGSSEENRRMNKGSSEYPPSYYPVTTLQVPS